MGRGMECGNGFVFIRQNGAVRKKVLVKGITRIDDGIIGMTGEEKRVEEKGVEKEKGGEKEKNDRTMKKMTYE